MTAKEYDFKKKFDEFKKMLEWFESDDIDLSVAPKKYQQAQRLADELNEYLKTAENEINTISKKFDK